MARVARKCAKNSFLSTPRAWIEQASVDRLVGHAGALIIRMCSPLQPACNLLRRPFAFELHRYCVAKHRPVRQLAGLRTPGPDPGPPGLRLAAR